MHYCWTHNTCSSITKTHADALSHYWSSRQAEQQRYMTYTCNAYVDNCVDNCIDTVCAVSYSVISGDNFLKICSHTCDYYYCTCIYVCYVNMYCMIIIINMGNRCVLCLAHVSLIGCVYTVLYIHEA